MILPEIYTSVIICNSKVTCMNQSKFHMCCIFSCPRQGDLAFAILEFKAAHILHWYNGALHA